ncbi:MAG: class I adenylate-forming enzyme family protein [Hyphomicrobiaceae bacterium]
MNIADTLHSVARYLPDRPALSWDGGSLTYRQLEQQVAAIAGGLVARHGLQPGDRVAIALENAPEFYPALYGIWRAGLTAVPINNKLHAKEMAWIIDNSGARLCIAGAKIAEGLSAQPSMPTIVVAGSKDYQALLAGTPIAVAPESEPACAWLFYTSGTTGRPKGAMLTHANLLFALHAYYADIDYIDDRDTILHAAPLSHGSGLYGLAHIARGSHNVLLPGSFEPDRVFDALRRYENVSMFAAPTMVARLINHPAAADVDTRNLKTLIYGGAAMYAADLARALKLLGPKLYNLYGQGESPMTITGLSKRLHADAGHPRYAERIGSTGVARTGVEVKVVGEDGHELPPGEIGEIVTRSACVMAGYWENAAATEKALRDGWLWTGDLGAQDADGFVTIKDRSKDLIISGGSNIYPREIEEVLLTHPDIAEAAVIGRPHADWGEEVVAFVVTRAGADVTVEALDRLCLDNIARFKRPKSYRFVPALPKNNYGKVLKTELRDQDAASSQ